VDRDGCAIRQLEGREGVRQARGRVFEAGLSFNSSAKRSGSH
jgi:hypothetical protein